MQRNEYASGVTRPSQGSMETHRQSGPGEACSIRPGPRYLTMIMI